MRVLGLAATAAFLMLGCSPTRAGEDRLQREIPAESPRTETGDLRADKESAQAIEGKFHTVISPLFNHARGHISYIRLKNNQFVPVTYTVTVVGFPSGRVSGTGTLTVPPRASPQYSYTKLIDLLGIGPPPEGVDDTGYSLYLSAALEGQAYQHVIFNPTNFAMQNMSVCQWDKHSDNRGVGTSINNVHTTAELMAQYPSRVGLHHYGTAPARYRARIYRSTDGVNVASFSFAIGPNEYYEARTLWWQFTWTPQETDLYFNIEFSREDGGAFEAIPSHMVHDTFRDTYVNMTQFCPIKRTEPAPATLPERIPMPDLVPES